MCYIWHREWKLVRFMLLCELVEHKFWKHINFPKCLYHSKGIFLGLSIEFVWLDRNSGYGRFFEVAKFESILKIELAPVLVAQDPIFAWNLDLTRER